MGVEFNNYWNWGVHIGIFPDMNYRARVHVYTLNAFCLIGIIIVLLFVIISLALGSYTALQGLLTLPLMLLVIYLNSKRRAEQARFIIVYVMLFIVLGLALADRRTGTEYALIAIACSSVIFYESLVKIILAFVTAVLCYGFYIWYDSVFTFTADPTIPYTLVQNLILFLTVFAILIQSLIFRTVLNQYASRLENANEEIKVNNEELQAINNHLDEIVKEKSEELKNYIEAINVNIYATITDVTGKILQVNPPLLAVSGFEEHELVGKDFRFLNSGHQSPDFYKTLWAELIKGNIWRGEVENKDKDGAPFWMDMVIMPIFNSDRKIKQFLSLSLPITERKRAEDERELATEKLQKSEARYRAMVESQPDFISLCDAQGNRIFVNEMYSKFVGLDAPKLLGTNYLELRPKGFDDDFIDDIRSLSPSKPYVNRLQLNENDKGEKRWIHWRALALFDDEGVVFEHLFVGRDVTELKEAEEQRTSYLQLLEKVAFETSHSIRGPIARIVGLIYLVDRGAIKQDEITSIVKRLKVCVNELDKSTRSLDRLVTEKKEGFDTPHDSDDEV